MPATLVPSLFKKDVVRVFNDFVTLQSSEDRTHKQHVSIEGILEGVPVLSGYTTMVGLYPNL